MSPASGGRGAVRSLPVVPGFREPCRSRLFYAFRVGVPRPVGRHTVSCTGLSWLPANAARHVLDPALHRETPVHLHVQPYQGVGDGVSAGAAIGIALLSALTARLVRSNLAMTGELLPVGAVKAKVLAARREVINDNYFAGRRGGDRPVAGAPAERVTLPVSSRRTGWSRMRRFGDCARSGWQARRWRQPPRRRG